MPGSVEVSHPQSIKMLVLRSGEDLPQAVSQDLLVGHGGFQACSARGIGIAPEQIAVEVQRAAGSRDLLCRQARLQSLNLNAPPGIIHRSPVCLRGQSYVPGALQAALNLETRDSGVDELRHKIQRHQILRRQKILDVFQEVMKRAIDEHSVRHPAALRALAAIRRPASPGFTAEALPGVAHAERPVHEDFNLHSGLRACHLLNLLPAELPREHHARHVEVLRGEVHPLRARDGHLRRRMDRKVRRDPLGELGQSNVLNDQRIRARARCVADRALGLGHLVLEHQHVEGDVAFHSMLVQIAHDLRELRLLEVVRAGSRIQPRARTASVLAGLQAEVHRVGPVPHRGYQLIPATRRRKDLWPLPRSQQPPSGVVSVVTELERPLGGDAVNVRVLALLDIHILATEVHSAAPTPRPSLGGSEGSGQSGAEKQQKAHFARNRR
eukprot:scaffold134_cov244-Pinguiococcus_pyrenoidosus.AAC.1